VLASKTANAQNSNSANKSPIARWGFCYAKIILMDKEPDTTNVSYIDEYPELAKRVWLRRLAQQRLVGSKAVCEVFVLPEPPDGAA